MAKRRPYHDDAVSVSLKFSCDLRAGIYTAARALSRSSVPTTSRVCVAM